MTKFKRNITYCCLILFFFGFSYSDPRFVDIDSKIQIMASEHAFDFITWTGNAVWVKLNQSVLGAPRYFSPNNQHLIVRESMDLVEKIQNLERKIDLIYGDPAIKDPISASSSLKQELNNLTDRWEKIAPFAEASLEMQVTSILSDLGLTTGGQPIPWVLYHVTPLPQNLVISKREKIGAETNFILTPLSISDASLLETKIDNQLNVSSLVVNIGGLAAYPTMIMRTSALDWLTSTIAHEWIHVYLGQRPLGNHYTTAELRTMNETTASIAGTEIGHLVMKRYFPELLASRSDNQLISHPIGSFTSASFDFRKEMHTTRVMADQLLSEGKIKEAETYMDSRRKLFWDNGYSIRKINQAYFAFFGSYADTPGGAAGEDPVGPAVRTLREKSNSLKDFLDRISAMTSFAELQNAAYGK